jgi:2-C-methyl-D-erythritol 2,4-cyclodiphosphate synthase
MRVKTGIGQDSHEFDFSEKKKKLVLGGVVFENHAPLRGNSDADVILHALTNAISGITGVNIIGAISDGMCLKKGITDSREYLKEALKYLKDFKITHVSITVEGQTPKLSPKIDDIKKSLASLLGLSVSDVGLTATTGESLTSFGQGKGLQSICVITAVGT